MKLRPHDFLGVFMRPLSIFLFLCFFVLSNVHAEGDNKYWSIERSDFDKVVKTFSFGVCDIGRFMEVSRAIGFSSTWRQFDDDPSTAENPLANLGGESLCLISLSSSFKAYQIRREQDGFYRSKNVGRENIFPASVRVDRLIFSLPKSSATQKCGTFDGSPVPYVIIIEKKDGKLVRRIDRTDAYEDCFIAALKKTGAIPRNLPVSQK